MSGAWFSIRPARGAGTPELCSACALFGETAHFEETNRPVWGDYVPSYRRRACPVWRDNLPSLGRRNSLKNKLNQAFHQLLAECANLLDKIYMLL